jgi:antitoxin component YwqK of YwqJK toxin-antitoxin module
MKSKTFATCVLFFFLVSTSVGQQREYIYHFNAAFKICNESQSLFTGHGVIKNSLLNLRIYPNKFPDTTLIIANFTDSTLSVNQGLFQSFYLDGIKESERSYENNVLEGPWRKWDKTGHLTDSLIYSDGKLTDSSKFYYYENHSLSSFSATDFKNDTYQVRYFNDSGKLTSEVYFIGQKGTRKDYKNGTIQIDSLFTRSEKEASFRGGLGAWQRYITSRLSPKIKKFSESDYGTCVIRFIIDTDGKVSDVKATTMQGSKLAKISVDAIADGPKWIPAMQYGKPVRAYRLQPVTLTR